MSRITGVTLLPVILVVSFYPSTAQPVGGGESSLKNSTVVLPQTGHSNGQKQIEEQKAIKERRVTEQDRKNANATASHERPIHVCGCTVRPNGKLLCLQQQKQKSVDQMRDLGRCLCSKPDQHRFTTACEWFRKFIEPKLSLIPSTPL
ncbi:uncharacterized protein AB9X84_015104 [Acanthopagrus schlegelii]